MSAVQVIEWESGEVVRTVDTTGKGERQIERIMRGMLTNMDRDRFGVREVSDEEEREDDPAEDDAAIDALLAGEPQGSLHRMGEDRG